MQTTSERTGRVVEVQSGPDGYSAFVPAALPPDPPLRIDASLQDLLDEANQALGRLDGVTLLLPDPGQFLYSYIRKEAVLSSQIEGTQSSLSDLLLFENEGAPGVPLDDVEETSNYISAMSHGLRRIESGELPLSNRLLREVHEVLMSGVRGGDKAPGEFRRSQNWLGGTRPGNARFVPPPADDVLPAMSSLEKFLHDDPVSTPILIKAALAHVQFETIHPFLDGNGRVGRLLITLLLCAENVLQQPLLYLSLYFKQNRDAYYEHLQRVRTDGAWEEWLVFFLEGVIAVATSATETARRIRALVEADRARVHGLGRGAASALRVHELAGHRIVLTATRTAGELGLSVPTVNAALGRLEKAGVLREVTGRKRGRLFVYDAYLSLLQAEQ
ncbi:MAG: Fic family protein [Solirubrobacterales bacterium]|nr:Fic family protein [Solirubrobacterales bacterium]